MAILLFDWGGTSIKYGVWEQDSLAETASVKTPDSWDKMKAQLLVISTTIASVMPFRAWRSARPATLTRSAVRSAG